jgi:hypothetical protein
MTTVRRARNSPANPPSFKPARSRRALAGPQPVLGDSEAPVSWAERKTPHFAGPFPKRLKGFEPSTFCMASSCSLVQNVSKCLQITVFGYSGPGRGRWDSRNCREIAGVSECRVHAIGTVRALPDAAVAAVSSCMERDSGSGTAAFHGCRSAVGADRAPADAWSSSAAGAARWTVRTAAPVPTRE